MKLVPLLFIFGCVIDCIWSHKETISNRILTTHWEEKSWEGAKKVCESNGGTLVKDDTAQINAFLVKYADNGETKRSSITDPIRLHAKC